MPTPASKQRFDQLQADDVRRAGRRCAVAQREIRSPRHHLRERQVRQVGAGDQRQASSTAGQQHPQRRPLLAELRVAQRHRPRRPAGDASSALRQSPRCIADSELGSRVAASVDARAEPRKGLDERVRSVSKFASVMFSGVHNSDVDVARHESRPA